MSNPIYKDLPPVERKRDGSLYSMTPAQHKQAKGLLRRECCSYDDGNCLEQDDGDAHICTQCISCSVCCQWFRYAVLPQLRALEAEIFKDRDTRRCVICGQAFVPKSNRAKYCPDCAAKVHRRQKVNGKGGQEWTIRGQKSQRLQGIFDTKPRWMVLGIIYPGKQGSNCTRIKYDKIYVYPSVGKGTELHKAAKLPV